MAKLDIALNQNLIVPMHVEARCINEKSVGEVYRGASADFSKLPQKSSDGVSWINGPYLGEVVDKFPTIPLEKGVHVHWALPDTITKGEMDKDNNLTFPAAPNRWLITRIFTSNKDPKTPINEVKSWIVESDYISMDPLTNFPASSPCETTNQYHFYLGKVYALNEWLTRTKEDKNYLKGATGKGLTSVGYGDINFSSYYPNCRNVFGFYDSLKGDFDIVDLDAKNNQITYTVNGWYEDEEDDVLSKYANTPEDLHWAFEGDYPTRSICNGTVQNVVWDPNKDYSEDNGESDLQVTIGNNDMECLSALFASNEGDSAKAKSEEYKLNALQLGILEKLEGDPDLPAKLEETLHDKAFDPEKSGTVWQLVKKANESKVGGSDLLKVGNSLALDLPESTAELLNQLNLLQLKYDQSHHQLVSLRESLYIDWYRNMQVQYIPDQAGAKEALPDKDMNDFSSDISDYVYSEQYYVLTDLLKKTGEYSYRETDYTVSSTSDAKSIAQQLVAKWNELKQAIQHDKVDYQLHLNEAKSYTRPTDPVILLSGSDATPSIRYGMDHTFSEDAKLSCRRNNEILQNLTYKNTLLQLTLSDLGLDAAYNGLPFIDDLSLLLVEAFIVDLNQSNYIASRLLVKPGAKEVPGLTFSQLATDLQVFQADLLQKQTLSSASFSVSGAMLQQPLALNIWQTNTWLPLYLKWEVEYHPVQQLKSGGEDKFGIGAITDNFSLDQFNVDFSPIHDINLEGFQKYSGTVLLTPHAFIDLKSQLTSFLKENPDEELSGLLNQIHTAPLLSQTLSGFNDALTMRHQVLQMAVKDPQQNDEDYQSDLTNLANSIQDHLSTNPLSLNDFNPIRSGFMKVSDLRLVDVFGKEKQLATDPDHLLRSENLTPATGNPNVDRLVYLAPRLSQHARLLFNWVSATDDLLESNEHPASSPICGWVIPDLLYEGLFFYSQDGIALGVLNLINNKSNIRWTSFPKEGGTVVPSSDLSDQAEEIKKAITNDHLLNFALSIFPQSADQKEMDRSIQFLDGIFNAVNDSVGTIIPSDVSEQKSLSVLIGRPLVLVRAGLKIDLKGFPVHELSWQALSSEVEDDPQLNRNTRGFTEVNFPVHMGDLSQVTDGLVGFFKSGEKTTDYGTFYAPAATETTGPVQRPNQNTVLINANPVSRTQYLTLLMDPQSKVNATTGIFPIQSLRIPVDQYEYALQKLQVAFPVRPLLSPKDVASVYKPLIAGYDWNWLYAAEGIWKNDLDIKKPSPKAEMNYSPQILREGWLVLSPKSES